MKQKIYQMRQAIKHLWEPKYLFIVGALYTILISIALLTPISGAPKIDFSHFDKILHIIIHAFLFIVWACYVISLKKNISLNKIYLFLFLGALIYGILIEVLQEQFVPTRGADVFDVVANLFGLVLGVFVIHRVRKFIQ